MAELRQVSIMLSGCQNWHTRIIGGDYEGKRFAFCSTLAIYIFDAEDYSLKRLIAGGFERNIIAMTWSPHTANDIVSCSVDGLLLLWDIHKEIPIKHIKIDASVTCIDWNPCGEDEIAFGTSEGRYIRHI